MTSPTARANAERRAAPPSTLLRRVIKRALGLANDTPPPRRTACGLSLIVAELRGIDPYRAPHAPRGTPAGRHAGNGAGIMDRATTRAAYEAGLRRDAVVGINPVYAGSQRGGVAHRAWQRKLAKHNTAEAVRMAEAA